MAKVSLRAYNREIESMIDRNHLDEAIAHCRHILQSFPKHLDTYRLLGKAYLEYKRYGDAVDIFSRVLVAVPNDFVANVGMSIIRDEQDKLDEAIWYMERAFETQPSNAAIQSELQRLYGRRDGVQLPRIRMTHGALAHMYVKGELYPQAIAEIKNVLQEDPGRHDMQTLLARAYYHSGARNEAAEAASAILRSEPYSLDANRILVELLGVDHPENVQVYRQRVVELDPYAAQVAGSMFRADEVSDLAVSLERLDWNGQPVPEQPEWKPRQASPLEERGIPGQQPDWLSGARQESSSESDEPAFEPARGAATPPFDSAQFSAGEPEPAEDIPDFLKAAGWGQATGAFDESKSAFFDEADTASGDAEIAPGELPEWIRAMAPEQPASDTGQEEDMPDWMSRIDTNSLTSSTGAAEQPAWMGSPEEAGDDRPDWLKGFQNEVGSSLPSTGELDWLSHLAEEPKADEASREVASSDQTAQAGSSADFDFLGDLKQSSEPAAMASSEASEASAAQNLGMSSEEQDDSFAWLESLAAKQGATEGLLTLPEERLDEEPDWVRQAKNMQANTGFTSSPDQPAPEPVRSAQEDTLAWLEDLASKQQEVEAPPVDSTGAADDTAGWTQQESTTAQPPMEQPSAAVPFEAKEESPAAAPDELGRSETEREDAFAWLEGLAARQGATEGLLTSPDERREEEPDWVKNARETGEQPAATIQDTEAWLKSLDEQDARPAGEVGSSKDDTSIWFQSLDPSARDASAPAGAADEVPDWLQGLEAEKTSETQPGPPAGTAPESTDASPSQESLPDWMQGIEEDRASETLFNIPAVRMPDRAPEEQQAPEGSTADLPEWIKGLDEERNAETGAGVPVPDQASSTGSQMAEIDTGWMSALDRAAGEPETVAEKVDDEPAAELPGWLGDLAGESDTEGTSAVVDDLPGWLRDETGEVVAEPPRIQPTRATDWQPARSQMPEPSTQPTEAEPDVTGAMSPAETAEPESAEPISQDKKHSAPPEPAAAEQKHTGSELQAMALDPVLGQAREELSGSNLSGAMENYARLIKKGRFLDEVIYDLREASYRFPVDVNIWQSLGDAYMRANRLQDALDAYTKAEELLR